MTFRNCFFLLGYCFFFGCNVLKKPKKNIDYGRIDFITHDIVTEEAALNQNASAHEMIEWMSKSVDSSERESFINGEQHNGLFVVAHHDSLFQHVEIAPEFYWNPQLLKSGKETGKGYYTDRDSMYQCLKEVKSDKCKWKNKVKFIDETKYDFQFFPKNERQIAGYKTFKILATRKDKFHSFEIYVTDEIILDYNPFLNVPSFKDKYYPLEVSKFTPQNKGIIEKKEIVKIIFDK